MKDPLDHLTRTIASTHTLQIVEFQANTVFHTPLEERFERVTRLARRLLGVRIAAITVLDEHKEWFKSVAGWNVSELPIDRSLAAKIAGTEQVCVVSDLTDDHRFWDHALVVGAPKFRFFACYPLKDSDENYRATFCVLDTEPRTFTDEDLQAFVDFGEIVQTELLTTQRNATVDELISKLGIARRSALIDPLTKVWNRQGADQILAGLIGTHGSIDGYISVCMVDIDGFKQINDTLGHPVGDEVLRKLAAKFVQCLRPSDIVCRMGGDEFLLILPEVDSMEATGIVDRIHRAISGQPVRTRKGNVATEFSVGYVTTDTHSHIPASLLIEQADQALLACKRQGRNRVEMARSA